MNQKKSYSLCRAVIQNMIKDEEQLPSLPSLTLKISQTINDPNSTINSITKLIQLDPSISTLLFKYVASPSYKQLVPPKTIEAVISIIGMLVLENLVMSHTIKNLFILKNPQLKKLFQLTWERMLYKAAISLILAKKIGLRPAEQAITTSLMTEIGTLLLLSAIGNTGNIPDQKTYICLCRKYSKTLTGTILNKWGLDKNLIAISQYCGRWNQNYSKKIALLDIINIAIYSTVQRQSTEHDLPPIETINSYNKLPQPLRELNTEGRLTIIQENTEKIDNIISTLK